MIGFAGLAFETLTARAFPIVHINYFILLSARVSLLDEGIF
jgi:hypothetical protein